MLPISTGKSGHHKTATTLKARNFVLRASYVIHPFFAPCCVGQVRRGEDKKTKERNCTLSPDRNSGLRCWCLMPNKP